MQRLLSAARAGRLALVLFLVACATLGLTRPTKGGDFQEYALMTIALASHASPDIRYGDVDLGARLSPEAGFVAVHERLRAGMARGEQAPFPGFLRGIDGQYYAIHFFAYPALAAIPFKLIQGLGGAPFKAFQVVNLAALAVLAAALLQFTASPGRAMFGTSLFLLCGGMLYANWCSPEFFTACALLAAMVFTLVGRPWLAALLSGLAAMQNPPLVFFSVFAPLIRTAYLHATEGLSLKESVRKGVDRVTVLASSLQVALGAAPILYNLAVFGMPSAIAHYSTDPALISLGRLASFFFDLNQGVIVGLPVAMALVLAQLAGRDRRRWLPHTLAALLFAIALALPSLSTVNWNSGANGLARYALWGSMPLLYLALCYLHRAPRLPLAVLLAIVVLQAGAMKLARSYSHEEFSPAARLMLAHLPGLYHPEPEIFIERALHRDGAVQDADVAAYPGLADPLKLMLNAASPGAHALLCGPGGRVALDDGRSYPGGWRYVDGRPRCASGAPAAAARR